MASTCHTCRRGYNSPRYRNRNASGGLFSRSGSNDAYKYRRWPLCFNSPESHATLRFDLELSDSSCFLGLALLFQLSSLSRGPLFFPTSPASMTSIFIGFTGLADGQLQRLKTFDRFTQICKASITLGVGHLHLESRQIPTGIVEFNPCLPALTCTSRFMI